MPLRGQDVPEVLRTNRVVPGGAPQAVAPMPPLRRLPPTTDGMTTNQPGVPQGIPPAVRVGALPPPTEALPMTTIQARLLYNVNFCTNEMALTNGCLAMTSAVAVGRLQGLFTQEFTHGKRRGDLKITFLPSLEVQRQSALLLEVETNVIKNVGEFMVTQTKAISPAPGDPAGAQKQKFVEDVNRAIEVWNKKALAAAASGSNWAHDWPNGVHTYLFQGATDAELKAIGTAVGIVSQRMGGLR